MFRLVARRSDFLDANVNHATKKCFSQEGSDVRPVAALAGIRHLMMPESLGDRTSKRV